MGNTDNINTGDIRLQGLLREYLICRPGKDGGDTFGHLDDDSLTAFTEGNLTSREADPLVAHLSDCSFCRHKTAELVRLEFAFADDDVTPAISKSEPSRVSNVVSGILGRLFGADASAVFAHEEKEENDENEKALQDEKEM